VNDSLKVCVVVPVRNRPDLLQSCLRSLQAQDWPSDSYEIFVCDDGSTSNMAAAAAEFRRGLPRVSLLHQPPKGPAVARNMGVRATRADILICLDSDVICSQDFLKKLISAMQSHPDWVAAEARIEPIEAEEGPLWDAPECQTGGRYHTAAIAYRRDALLRAGGFDETFPLAACEDVELAVRLLEQGTIGFVPEAVVRHPRRRVTMRTHWVWRQHWRYVMILAKRYGFLAFPGHQVGPFPRLRVALAAVMTLPAGRFLEGLKHMTDHPYEGVMACMYAVFDVFCGVSALPVILIGKIPPRLSYLKINEEFTPTIDYPENKQGSSHAAS
jgi:GT2 family glycosyltransferase